MSSCVTHLVSFCCCDQSERIQLPSPGFSVGSASLSLSLALSLSLSLLYTPTNALGYIVNACEIEGHMLQISMELTYNQVNSL